MQKSLKVVGILLSALITMIAVLFLLLWVSTYQKTEARIMKALTSHYEPAQIDVVNRVEWKFAGSSWAYGGQICFDVRLKEGDARQPEKRIAMVADGDDGGAFQFIREFPSMKACQAAFSRG